MSTAKIVYQLCRDMVPLYGPFGSYDEAWMKLLDVQGQSTAWAMKYEGWSIEREARDE